MAQKFGVHGIMVLGENHTETLPSIESLAKAETFSQAYEALFPSVRSIIMPYKDYCLFGSGVLNKVRSSLAQLKDYTLRNSRATEFMVDCAIERCVKEVNKEIADMREEENAQASKR